MPEREVDDRPDLPYGTSDRYLGAQGLAYHRQKFADEASGTFFASSKFNALVCSEDTVLDFGAGVGDALAGLSCRRRIAVEINPASRTRCAERGLETYADLSEVPVGLIDLIITNHCLEHVPYPIEALRQLRLRLKPEGRLAVCVPINDWRMQRRYDPRDQNHHLHTWTPQLLGNTLREAGFLVDPKAISIMNRTRPGRFSRSLYRLLPPRLFMAVCRLWAVMVRRRELFAVVSVRPDSSS
ncbi:MAG: class I SAM-dependent methyltransferase [Actinomycetota bacterium]